MHPALVFLGWEDLHPNLSWRARGSLALPPAPEVQAHADQLRRRLTSWLEAREGAESYVVMPPIAWLPSADHVAPGVLGPGTALVVAALWDIVADLAGRGGRLLNVPIAKLNIRDLLGAGCPLTLADSELAARQVVELIYGAEPRRKALVLDLDGTLWHGVIGEDGPQALAFFPEGLGFPFHVFQKFLIKLKQDGALLAFCTKNNPGDVLPVFDRLGMPLSLDDFAAYRCNWESKPHNLRAIAAELNIGLDSIVYVDDNPAELAEIASLLPEVRCFRTPRSGADWLSLFEDLQRAFATWHVSDEDRTRTDSFAQARQRQAAASSPAASAEPGSLQHLRGFDLELTVRPDTFGDPRSLELVNKTNQFNLTGKRWSAAEWLARQQEPGAFCVSARLRDRFGDFGTILVMTGTIQPDGSADLQQMVVSCRAFGRGVETVALSVLCQWGNVQRVSGRFVDTGRNAPTAKYLRALRCEWTGDGQWSLPQSAVDAASQAIFEDTGMKVHVSSGAGA